MSTSGASGGLDWNAGVQHLAVTDSRDAIVGLVSAGDLMGLAYWSPFALRAAIFNATGEAALDAATKEVLFEEDDPSALQPRRA